MLSLMKKCVIRQIGNEKLIPIKNPIKIVQEYVEVNFSKEVNLNKGVNFDKAVFF